MRQTVKISLLVACSFLAAGAYIVKEGDTLWDLSAQFLNDPFAWPDLWQQNQHIQNPNKIYPGDSLNIGAKDSSVHMDTLTQVEAAESLQPAVAPLTDSTLPKGIAPSRAAMSRDDEFKRNLGNLPNRSDTALDAGPHNETLFTYRHEKAPAVFNQYYQWLAPKLVPVAQLKEDLTWLKVSSGENNPSLLLHTGDEILVHTGTKKSAIKAGSIIEVWLAEPIQFAVNPDSTPRAYAMLRLAAFAKVQDVGDTLSRAHLTQTLAPITIGKAKIRLLHREVPIIVKSYQTVPEGKFSALPRIRYAVDPTLRIGAYSYVLADGGLKAGLNPGDGVAFLENTIQDPSLPPRVLGRGIVVTSSSNEAAVLVRELFNPGRPLDRGTRIAVTHRAIPK